MLNCKRTGNIQKHKFSRWKRNLCFIWKIKLVYKEPGQKTIGSQTYLKGANNLDQDEDYNTGAKNTEVIKQAFIPLLLLPIFEITSRK